MNAEHHAARRDRNRQADGDGERRKLVAAAGPPPGTSERNGRPQRRGRGRMAARERRPETRRSRVERRPDAVERTLDGVDEDHLAEDGRDEERRDPSGTEIRRYSITETSAIVKMAVYVPARSLTARNPSVERGDLWSNSHWPRLLSSSTRELVRSHQVGEEADQKASEDRHEEREGQSQTCHGGRVKAGSQKGPAGRDGAWLPDQSVGRLRSAGARLLTTRG